jgi:ribonuclease Z
MMKRGVQTLLVLSTALALFSCEALMERTVEKRLTRQRADLFQDGKLHVILVGSGGPINNSDRLPACTAVIAGGEFILIDSGPGTTRNADLLNLPLADLTGVFVTHLHSDHIADLGEATFQSWAAGRQRTLEIYGPKGIERVVQGFTSAYELDAQYRIAHHGESVMPREASRPVPKTISLHSPDTAELCFDRNGLKVYAFVVDHFPAEPAVGYRFEYKGNKLVITGDTKNFKALAEHAQNADLLLCDALSFRMTAMVQKVLSEHGRKRLAKIMSDILGYHMTPVQAAELAREANVKKLVLNHITPPVTNFFAKRMFMKGTQEVFAGEIVLGEDGMSFDLDPKR